MVKRLSTLLFLFATLLSVAWPAQASNDLTVEPDRTTLYEGEVLTLNVRGSMKIDINLTNLFDLDISSLPSPDIEKVEEDFEILGRNQRYNIRTVNNEMVGEITWTYELAPKRNGTLEIPSLSFQDTTSEAVTINVLSGTPPDKDTSTEPRDSFIELSTDKDQVYVQEQLVLTIKLFFSGNLIRGELSEPEHPDAIIESLGKQREYNRYRDGVRFRVVERRYAIYPQKAGDFSLNTIRFEGRARTPDGQLKFLRDSETLFDIPVKGIPPDFSGDTWLPASSLELSESGLARNQPLTPGQNLTRILALRADGLPAETLPPFEEIQVPGIRTYPESPERETETTNAGLSSSLSQATALVPVQAGDLILPEIRIPWWDTEADEEKVAVIPSRTLTVEAAPGQAAAPSTDEPAAPGSVAATPEPTDTEPATNGSFWPWLSLALGLAWFATAALWWHGRKQRTDRRERPDGDERESVMFEQLCAAAKAGASDTLRLLPQWANRHVSGRHFDSAADVVTWMDDDALSREIGALQAHLFGRPGQGRDQWQGTELVKILQRLRGKAPLAPEAEKGLPPLYPRELTGR